MIIEYFYIHRYPVLLMLQPPLLDHTSLVSFTLLITTNASGSIFVISVFSLFNSRRVMTVYTISIFFLSFSSITGFAGVHSNTPAHSIDDHIPDLFAV